MTTIEARTDERRSALTPLRVGALLALLAFTLATSAREVVQVDPFFHLAAGEWILDHGALPRQNVFLSSHPEAAFTDHEWLPQIVMALVYRSAGWSGLSLIKLATVLGFVTLVLLGPRRASPSARLAVTAGVVLCSYPRFILRPDLLSLCALAAQMLILERAPRSGPRTRELLALAGLQWLWAQSHGLFFLGPALTGCSLLEALVKTGPGRAARRFGLRRRQRGARRLAALLGLQLLACCAGPYGLSGALYPFEKIASSAAERARIIELASPFASLGAAQLDAWAMLALGALATLSAARLARLGRLRVGPVALALGLGLAAAGAARTLPFAALALAPLLYEGARALRTSGRAELITLTLLCLAQLGALGASLEGRLHRNGLFETPLGLGLADTFQASGALRAWRASPPAGRYFNLFSGGHYLIFAARDLPQRPYICGNTDLYPRAFYDRYSRVVQGLESFAVLSTEQRLDDALIDHRLAPALVEVIAQDPSWRLTHLDWQSACFRRAELPGPSLDIGALARGVAATPRRHPALVRSSGLPPGPYQWLHLAHALCLLPSPEALAAADALAKLSADARPGWSPPLLVRARVAERRGKFDRAAELYDALCAAHPRAAALALAAANSRLLAGDHSGARDRFESALRLGAPGAASERGLAQCLLASGQLVELRRRLARSELNEAWRSYFRARACAREGDLKRAAALYGEALDAQPSLTEARYYLAELRYREGGFAAASRHLEALLEVKPGDADAWDYLAAARYQQGDAAGAAVAWGHALSLDPGRPNSALNRGRALLACGHHAEAAKLARKALELSSKLRDPKARASLELAARRLLEESR